MKLTQLSAEEKVKLTSGADFWSSESLPEHDIPSFKMSDGPHGLRYQAGAADHLGINKSVPATCFPTASASASSWNPQLLEKMGAAIAKEAQHFGVTMVLGPGVNIKRNPLCGRNFEYFSEDPYLAGELGAAWIKGLQAQGMAACVKHFAANNQENDRLLSDSLIDERTLREIYLEPFRLAVQTANPEGVMCSYNKVNGTYTSDSRQLLTQILRKEWGFSGAVITDWGALNDKVASLNAGTDLEMPSSQHMFDQEALAALAKKELNPEALDRAVRNIAAIATKKHPQGATSMDELLVKHEQLARQIETESAVLLKNEGVLPLTGHEHLAVIGQMAQHTRYQGAGSSHINPPKEYSILQGLDAAHCDYQFASGYTFKDEVDDQLQQEAVLAAQAADKVILVVGLPESYESEGFDRQTMSLPEGQNSLIKALVATHKPIIVLLIAGAPVELPWLDQVQAVLNLYLGGEAVGLAAADLITGKVNPSGKLAESYPIKYTDVPSAALYGKNNRSVAYAESLYVGYRYYEKAKVPVAFPFGFGLSYTTFELTDVTVDHTTISPTHSHLTISVTVKNNGDVDGAEVVQVYVGARDKTFNAAKSLKAFKKVKVVAHSEQRVTIELPQHAFEKWNSGLHKWVLNVDLTEILVGSSSQQIVANLPILVEGETSISPVPNWYQQPQGYPSVADFEQLSGLTVQGYDTKNIQQFSRLSTLTELAAHSQAGSGFVAQMRQGLAQSVTDPTELKFLEAVTLDVPIVRLAQQSGGQLTLTVIDQLIAAANKESRG